MKKALAFLFAAGLLAFAIVLVTMNQRASQRQARSEIVTLPDVPEVVRPAVKPSPVERPAAPEATTVAPAPELPAAEEKVAAPAPPATPVLPTPPAVTLPPATPAPAAKAPKPAKVPGAKKKQQEIDSANAVIPLPVAREALGYVGVDSEANAVWFMAINDPDMSPKAREDLIEDLNEVGFVDPKNPSNDELELIENRIEMIEQIGPYAMDKVNYDAFREAYKDLVNMYLKMQK